MLARTFAVVMMNLRSLPARWGVAAVVVICMAGVAGVLVTMLAMSEGFEQTFQRAGRPDRVVVLSKGEFSEATSSIARDQLPLLLTAPGLRVGADGKPLVSVERFTLAQLPRADGADANLVVRGVSPQILSVRPEVRIAQGRMFTPGLRELIVGSGALHQFPQLALGREVSLSGENWTVVGAFDAGGSALASEVWADVEAVMNAYHQVSYSALTGLLATEQTFTQYQDAVTSNPSLAHEVKREPEYFAAQGGVPAKVMRIIGYVVASIMALGALFAAVNTMYASIESRSVEIATLRAIGFSGGPIVFSVLLESVLLCAAGALLGGLLAHLIFNGYTASTLSPANFSQVSFAFAVTPGLLARGVMWACVIGLAGGLLPALRAARVPIIEGLRAA